MKIKVIKEFCSSFECDEYEVNLSREFEGYEMGDLICSVFPFEFPLRLEIAIRSDGAIAFRSWQFTYPTNYYLHTHELNESDCEGTLSRPFISTEAQIDTVSGLFSGRIKYEGLKISVGATVQKICPIDIKKEERLIGKTIYLT